MQALIPNEMEMEIEIHQVQDLKIAEVVSEDRVINTAEDSLDLLGTLYFQGFDRIILHEKNITPDFFDLKTGIAGEILQKFSNYRVHLGIVGDFRNYQSKNFQDFIFESNRNGQINFVESISAAVKKLSI